MHACTAVYSKACSQDGHWKHRKYCAFVCLFLMLAEAQALNLCHPQVPGPSSCHRGACKPHRGGAPVSDRNPRGEPTSLSKEFKPAGKNTADDCLGQRARSRGNLGSKVFNMLPHRVTSLHVPASRRAAIQLTPGRQAVEVLFNFKAGIVGGNLSIFDEWDANDASPCGWIGVTCLTSTDQVMGLSLVGYELEGSINSALFALGQLHSLHRLDLSNNKYGSFISGAILLNFSSLASMNLSYNQLEGQIPHQIEELTNIQSLAFQFNNLSGFPPSICNCSVLRELNLQGNLLKGQIPQDIGKLKHLEVLVLGNYVNWLTDDFGRLGNHLTGGLPSSLGNCTSLSILNLDLNHFEGQIPEEVGKLQHLQIFACSACFLSGVLPRSIGNLTNVIDIHLSYNLISGTIPAEIGRLRSLSWLAIGRNFNLTGDLPAEIGNCTSLTRLRFCDTAITGLIPSGLGNCSLLKDFELCDNPLLAPAPLPSWLSSLTELETIVMPQTNRRGTIPTDLANLPRLNFLDFGINALVGLIPSSLSNCTSLEDLSLRDNHLKGHIPDELGALQMLLQFEVSGNLLTGSFPSFIANMTVLQLVAVESNSLGGTIDKRLGLLPNLKWLYLAYNLFVGSIPTALSNCSYLERIFGNDNFLTGEIPSSFGNLSRLRDLIVSTNNIKGKIPADLASCSALNTLDLSSNKLEGPFPAGLGYLPFLTSLKLSHNKLNGSILHSVGNLTDIISLDLAFNQFSGEIPWESVSNLIHMVSINFSHNFLSGFVAASLGTLEDLEEIDFSGNNISGTIPMLDGLRPLKRLDISLNNFSGNIPKFLALLPNLVFFNASYNNLDGPIPEFRHSQSNITAASFLGNAELCGAMLGQSRECPRNVSSSVRKCKPFQCTRTWIPLLVAGVVCILVISVLVAWAVRRSRPEREEFDILLNFRSNFLKFSSMDILAIIRDEGNVIGTTTASLVYKGLLPGCHDVIAIKTFVGHDISDLDPRETDLWRQLLEREADLQSRLHHRNVLRLLSFCSHARFQALLFEYMPQGSLHDHLYPHNLRGGQQLPDGQAIGARIGEDGASSSEQICELPWSVRLGIAMDIAEGMTYLHHECHEPLIYGDLKPSNILLDKEMVAKVSDFGISKLVSSQRARGGFEDGEATVSKICGTVGYMPPEYALVGTVSTKGDVYSYGILLLEMLSGTPPTAADLSGQADYRDRSLHYFQESPSKLLDPTLECEARTEALKKKQMMLLAKVALFATRENSQTRPSMKEIRSMLVQIKGLEVEAAPRRRTVDELAQDTDEFDVAVSSLPSVWENVEPGSGT